MLNRMSPKLKNFVYRLSLASALATGACSPEQAQELRTADWKRLQDVPVVVQQAKALFQGINNGNFTTRDHWEQWERELFDALHKQEQLEQFNITIVDRHDFADAVAVQRFLADVDSLRTRVESGELSAGLIEDELTKLSREVPRYLQAIQGMKTQYGLRLPVFSNIIDAAVETVATATRRHAFGENVSEWSSAQTSLNNLRKAAEATK